MVFSKKIFPTSSELPLIKELYEASFPEEERLSWTWMLEMTISGQAELQAYYVDRQFCGFTYSLVSPDAYYLLFFAVLAHHQSKGYGTSILSSITQQVGNRPVFLVIEPMEVSADNYPQRVKRLDFYQRNGYHLTDYLYYENQEVYQVMTNQSANHMLAFEKIARQIEDSGIKIRIERKI